ncbi:MAG: hypothetical protein ABW056_09740 [Thermoanaerobaculia bacterium]
MSPDSGARSGSGALPGSSTHAAFVAAALAVAATILSLQLFVSPIVGMADNRDYERVMGYAGFQHTTPVSAERYFSFLRSKYAVVDPGWFRGGYHSSETLLAFVARGVHLLVAGRALFDIRLMGVIHAVLFLLALAGLIRACRDLTLAARAVSAVLLVFFFTDVGYVAPFNSFYSQTASFVFLMLTAAIAAEAIRRGRLSGVWLFAYFGAALLFVGSKPQEKLAAPLLALFGLRLAGAEWDGAWLRRAWRQVAVWLAAGLVAFSVWYGRHTPYTLREATLFQVVFDDLLAHSPSPAEDAAELRLDREWLQYVGTNPYATDSPLLESEFRIRFLQRIGHRQIFAFYLRHPARFAQRVSRASLQAWSLRPEFGNFERSAEHPTKTLATRFSLWSRSRERLGANPLIAIAALLGGNLVVAVATYGQASRRGRLFREGLLTMVLMAMLAFAVCAFAQGSTDLSRSLYAYHTLCDLLIVADAAWIAETLARRASRLAV